MSQPHNRDLQAVPKEEEVFLDYLLKVRQNLSDLKQNRSQFLNSKDIQFTYQRVLTKVRELDEIRRQKHGNSQETEIKTFVHSPELHNRVDNVLDDVFQLLSLCFITCGLKNSAPATYASLSTVQSLLEHLIESKIYTHHDLKPIKERLDEIAKIVDQNCESNTYQDASTLDDDDNEVSRIDNERNKNKIEQNLLLQAKLNHCLHEYNYIESQLEEVDPSSNSLVEKLFQIRRNLVSLVEISKSNTGVQDQIDKKLKHLQLQLNEIENNRDPDGNFVSIESGNPIIKGSNVLNGLSDDCHDLISDLTHHTKTFLDPDLQNVYDNLIDVKGSLENLMVTRRWTLRETDLFSYLKKLNEIDNLRVDGKFPTKSGSTKGQAILLYLLRRCYTLIYKLLESSEPVSEALQPIHNQLSTVRRCLLDLKRMGGVNNERELYPYQMKLASLDNLRKDGKFYDSKGNIPEGQGILNALLAGCFDILHELKIEAEEHEEDDEGDNNDDDDDDEHKDESDAH
ncbi:hypothetical protein KAFR_0L00460 [Kazachstania africana CBS 2517]|uniref:Uncharacterized protein n=1 Tax=Kazachstania africana (strain ATCC 22294 / BCRC 22015 / CBS 2517 / CECT 1963 / NBRC 1671 / NRRL Y-8276) TaxID=1071382 RepID=H2B203_KAZAF|nr:hypothetical protein KAFR_0L00460 [Kazachstania africana CBS 2517]CCF60653.1 hypothetical protein KAFR_0L00460 [Kazachstania africana CBS 2517]